MILSDNEIRDITKFLEAGKSLPDKYRFKLFEEKREVELVWNGKTNEVTDVVLPFQIIEQIDEPRAETDTKLQMGFDFDERGRQIKGWTNKLIWGDNKLILSSLKNGPLREEIEKEGGIKLIYIDPPFDVGADFSMDIEIGDETLTKTPTVLEQLAYRDTWGKGTDSWIAMMSERLQIMRDLLADSGTIYVHVDYRVSGYLRLLLDEIFNRSNFLNETIWCYGERELTQDRFNYKHDTIFYYAKNIENPNRVFNCWDIALPYSEGSIKKYNLTDKDGRKYQIRGKGGPYVGKQQLNPEVEKDHPEWTYRDYFDTKRGILPRDWFSDITFENRASNERTSYPTQKPTKLLEKLIKVSSNKNDLIADFFQGSGTTLAVAERLERKWIGSDLSKFAIHTARKRMIGVQRELKKAGKDYRPFEILNLGKYERQHYIGINPNLTSDYQQKQSQKREKDFVNLILKAYKSERVDGFETFYGKKSGRMVSIGPINLPVTRLFVEEVINECIEKKLTKADILAFEFEMGLFPNIMDQAKDKGIDLALKYIPPDVFDKRAVEKNQVVFHDVCYIEVKPIVKKGSVSVELIDFSVFYNQESIAQVESLLKNGGNKVVVENGQIIKVSKDKDGIVSKEVLTKKWTDWIDYWAVDFDFENKKEIIRVLKVDAKPIQKKLVGEDDSTQLDFSDYEEKWTGDYIFENEWQSFRTKKNRDIGLTSISKQLNPGRRKIAVKVVDIFGNDTMKVIEVNI
jgi:DNA modification methylase